MDSVARHCEAPQVAIRSQERNLMAFRKQTARYIVPDSPELLHRNLPRGPNAVAALWTHQGDVLRAYIAEHQDSSDVALELPTGTGKTLPGLLIAEWVRLKRGGHVIYACPTQQLARQVFETAQREGISGALLVGSHKYWSEKQHTSFVAAECIAITTYSSIFNISPKLEVPELIVFDDAHSGEQYVAGAYNVEISRAEDEHVYLNVLKTLTPLLDGIYVQRLENDYPDQAAYRQVRMVVPAQDSGLVRHLSRILTEELEGSNAFRFSMIASGLASCVVCINHSTILVRPLIPPTHDNALFREAKQRIYLSATLGHGGELERAFGRRSIDRLPLPDSSPTPRSGRRLFVFADLADDMHPDELAKKIARTIGKALVLTPDRKSATRLSNVLAHEGWQEYGGLDIDGSLAQFAVATNAVCGLASRYDGIDLPGNACRLVVLEGLPDGMTLLERFMSVRARAGLALAERVRTRVVQGSGRCTRGPGDLAVVVIRGSDLSKYLLNPGTREALDPELQSEISFGIDNSRMEANEIIENVEEFLEQGEPWLVEAEEDLTDRRRSAVLKRPAGGYALARSARLEIDACSEAWSGRWAKASSILEEAATVLGEGGDGTRGYRAMLLYLAGVWSHRSGTSSGAEELKTVGHELVRQADKAAHPAQWVKEMRPLSEDASVDADPVDEVAASEVARELQRIGRGKHSSNLDRLIEGLSQSAASQYEPALTELGRLIGAEAWKPSGTGRCDSVWRWKNHIWVAVEAKSEQQSGKLIPHKYIRQVNDQLRLLQRDLVVNEIPEGSIAILVSPRTLVDPAASGSAEAHVFLSTPNEFLHIANSVVDAWRNLLGHRKSLDGAALQRIVLECFRVHGVLPSQILDQLTKNPAGEAVAV